MKVLLLLLFLVASLFGAKAVETRWLEGQSFSSYLADRNASIGLIRDIDEEDRELLSEIRSGVKFYELFSKEGTLLQALIPVGEEMQIQIVREGDSSEYTFDIIPIHYVNRDHQAVIAIQSNPHTDIKKATNNQALADKIDRFFKDNIDSHTLHKNDTLAMIYTQKERLGKPFSSPEVKIAMIESGENKRFIYADEKGIPHTDTFKTVTYDIYGNPVTKEQIKKLKSEQEFGMPVRHIRISSPFSYMRWHPIFHRYRPHLGVDFAARRGTPILSVNAGTVIYSGYEGGYGNVAKIRHQDGYVSLYAHQSHIRVTQGEEIEKGELIGYVGSTGSSTGPHLHFGLYKNGEAIDPLQVLKKKGTTLVTFITKKIEIKGAKKNRAKVMAMLKNPPKNLKWEKMESNMMSIQDKEIILKAKEI